jgi:hypothetical protein
VEWLQMIPLFFLFLGVFFGGATWGIWKMKKDLENISKTLSDKYFDENLEELTEEIKEKLSREFHL